MRVAGALTSFSCSSSFDTPEIAIEDIDRLEVAEHYVVGLEERCAQFSNEEYGPEFTFTSSRLIEDGRVNGYFEDGSERKWTRANKEKYQEWVTYLSRNRSADVLLITTKDSDCCTRVTYRDGWWYQVSCDPGVIEIQTAPMTVAKALLLKERVDRVIFSVAQHLGLAPHPTEGGGHMNLSLEPFLRNPLLFRNFIVDYIHHPTLALGSFGSDIQNASPAALRFSSRRESPNYRNLSLALKQFDEQWEAGQRNEIMIYELARALNQTLFSESDDRIAARFGQESVRKQQALTLRHVSERVPRHLQRLEIRAHHPQSCFAEWILLASIYDERMGYLSQLEGPLPLRPEKELAVHVEPNEHLEGVRLISKERRRLFSEMEDYVPEAAATTVFQLYLGEQALKKRRV